MPSLRLGSLLLPVLIPAVLRAQQPTRPAPPDTTPPAAARESHGWPVLGRLARLCDGRVYGRAEEISWELFTSPDPPGEVVAAYRRRLVPLAPESAGAQWTFRARDGALVTGVLTIGPSPAVTGQHCPAAPPRTRTYALFSRMMRRP